MKNNGYSSVFMFELYNNLIRNQIIMFSLIIKALITHYILNYSLFSKWFEGSGAP